TSIDERTSKSDATGHFQLTTTAPLLNDQPYTVTVRAPGGVVDDKFLVGPWSPARQRTFPIAFVLSPPQPIRVGVRAGLQNRAPMPDVLSCAPALPARSGRIKSMP